MKLTSRSNLKPRQLKFLAQLGVTHLSEDSGRWLDADRRGVVDVDRLRADIAMAKTHDLKIEVALLPQPERSQHWNIRMGKPQREKEIFDVCRSLEILGGEGVPVVEYVFNLAAVYGHDEAPAGRGGAMVRRFEQRRWDGDVREDFAATHEQVWDRIAWFLDRALPVAEKAGVKLACHPDDPPVPLINGDSRVTGSREGMTRLLDMFDSPSNGLNFCVGTVIEMGIDVLAAIRDFGSRGRIHHLHFRNVKGHIPNFHEAFLDDGDLDMAAVLQTLADVGYDGPVMPEHPPTIEGDDANLCHAHDIGYTKALIACLRSPASANAS
jgi:mannonate dehydratase